MTVIIAAHNNHQEFIAFVRHSTIEITCYGTQLSHYEFTGSFEANDQSALSRADGSE
ncbi:MAG: hypothetical protein WC829_08435 [Hyphomicrobium sp.]|jgi:hypothetical protein